ncbi:pre-toxin TG domain-containing protein [Bacillus mycoides]|uniref:pre-toxin TG domain-containing protein n=1 Tax=Bacillus mycoides TaxID=1405 RepID=UPI002E1FC18F|nr:pre-toxin TG domain-containing protein [Bacillus mycoides]
MSLNMYLGEVQSQTQNMNAVCTATIQGMEQAIQSIDAFAVDTVLQGQTYSSAKAFFAQTFRPLAQGIIYLCEELIRQNNAFPNDFQSQVASTDVIEQELREQIQEIDRMKANMEAISQAMPTPGMDAMANLFTAMRQKLQEKLENLHEFNYTSSSNYDTALQLAASIAQGLAEVQSGKGFSPASGTFSTQGLNMEWTTSIQAITEDRNRQTDNLLNSSSIEEGAIDSRPSSESEEKGFDGKKLARDIAGEISGEYDVRRAWDGIDPSTGEKLATWERVFAGGMAVAGLTPVGKLAKVGKGVKMTHAAIESKNLLRGEDYLKSATRPNGIGKPHIGENGNLIPANKEGIYKGRQVTVTEHILGGYRRGAKHNSPYTSFSINPEVASNYGKNIIDIDLPALRKGVREGEVTDVAILSPKQIERLIKQDSATTDHWKNLALNWTKRDTEYLIRGEIPSKYFNIKK